MKDSVTLFEGRHIRRLYDEKTEAWYFSVIDILQVLIQQADYQTARKYWNKLKERLKKEGSESVTNCHRLKLLAADGKKYLTDVANAETFLSASVVKNMSAIRELYIFTCVIHSLILESCRDEREINLPNNRFYHQKSISVLKQDNCQYTSVSLLRVGKKPGLPTFL